MLNVCARHMVAKRRGTSASTRSRGWTWATTTPGADHISTLTWCTWSHAWP